MAGPALRRLGAAALAVTTLGGCQTVLDLHVSGSMEQPVITVVEWPSTQARSECIKSVVVGVGRSQPLDTLWSIRHDGPGCRRLDRIDYGVTPRGFITLTPPRALRSGVPYAINAGRPGASGYTIVRHSDGAWRLVTQ